MRRAVAILGALGLAGAILGAGLWMAGRRAPEPAAAAAPEREVIREDPEALVCDEAPGNPEPAARHAWPLTFAGLWLEEKERMLYVAFTEGAEEKVARLAECLPKRSFTPVAFEHSERELLDVLDRMRADREAIRAGRLTLPGIQDEEYSFGLYTKENVILIHVATVTPEAVETFTTRYGDFVVLEGGGPGGPGGPEPAINTEVVSCDDARWGADVIARGVWPDTFAGEWVRPGRMFLAFTEGAEEKVRELSECFPDDNLVPVTVERSAGELQGLADRISADLELIASGRLSVPGIPVGRYDLAVFPRRNSVLVWLEELDPDVMAAFERRYGDALVFRELGPGAAG
jgi:hypothetical protein